jgi:hypothetical protein
LQPYCVVAADALLLIGATIISAGLSLDGHLSHTNTSVSRKFDTSLYIVVLFGTSLPGYTLGLNASRTAADDYDAMNI